MLTQISKVFSARLRSGVCVLKGELMNRLVTESNALLLQGGFEYAYCGGQAIDLFLGYESRKHGDIDICAYWPERDKIISFMQSRGFEVYEMLGGGKTHRITDIGEQMYLKRNIFCFRDGCPLVKLYPTDETDIFLLDFLHVGQTEFDFIELLFNDRSETHFEYARDREIKRELSKAILSADSVPYLSPEICLLYKSTDIEREGYQQDYELAYAAMSSEQKEWLDSALKKLNPHGHKWLK